MARRLGTLGVSGASARSTWKATRLMVPHTTDDSPDDTNWLGVLSNIDINAKLAPYAGNCHVMSDVPEEKMTLLNLFAF